MCLKKMSIDRVPRIKHAEGERCQEKEMLRERTHKRQKPREQEIIHGDAKADKNVVRCCEHESKKDRKFKRKKCQEEAISGERFLNTQLSLQTFYESPVALGPQCLAYRDIPPGYFAYR